MLSFACQSHRISVSVARQETYWPKEIKKKKRMREQEDGKRKTRRVSRALDTSSSTSSKTKATAFNEKTLHPTGKLSCRLNTSVQHFPECSPTTRRRQCQLHRWARGREGKEERGSILTCSICRVHLCISCYKLFHAEANIVGKKDEIAVVG